MTSDDCIHPNQRCDGCGGSLRILYREAADPQTGQKFSILKCVNCGLGHTMPQPADIGPYYGPLYHGGRHGMTDRLCMRRRIDFVRSVAHPATLLDFGCGDGGFLEAATAQGWRATGVEVKPEIARARGLQVVENVSELPETYDVVTLWHSLEHMYSPNETLKSLVPKLSADGRMFIAVPNARSLQARIFSARWFHLDPPRHLFHFTPGALDRLLAEAGLEIVKRWRLEAELDLFGWTQSLLNLILPTPNVLFDVLTRRRRAHAPLEIAASFVLGAVLTVLAAPLLLVTTMASSGAVMVVAAQRPR